VVSDVVFSFFFFFQAEDGIRDLIVTGVQTCALPILFSGSASISILYVPVSNQGFGAGENKSDFRKPSGFAKSS